jgi:hypothetical protein
MEYQAAAQAVKRFAAALSEDGERGRFVSRFHEMSTI